MKTRKDFRVGDKVFSLMYGSGMVERVIENVRHSVVVGWDSGGDIHYLPDGRLHCNDKSQTLFHGAFPDIPKEWIEVEDKLRLEDLKIDDKIMVGLDGSDMWYRRRFAGIGQDGRILTFGGGSDSWSGVGRPKISWERWRLPTEDEMLCMQLA